VSTDEGRYWTTPAREPGIVGHGGEPLYPAELRLISALQKPGISTEEALSAVADTWRPVRIADEFQICFPVTAHVLRLALRRLVAREIDVSPLDIGSDQF
jgi:hypothetical protein